MENIYRKPQNPGVGKDFLIMATIVQKEKHWNIWLNTSKNTYVAKKVINNDVIGYHS